MSIRARYRYTIALGNIARQSIQNTLVRLRTKPSLLPCEEVALLCMEQMLLALEQSQDRLDGAYKQYLIDIEDGANISHGWVQEECIRRSRKHSRKEVLRDTQQLFRDSVAGLRSAAVFSCLA